MVVRSVLCAQIFAFSCSGDAAILVRPVLRTILSRDFQVRVLDFSSNLFSVVVKYTTTTEKRLVLGSRGIREALQRRQFMYIGWVYRKRHPHYGLTKVITSPSHSTTS